MDLVVSGLESRQVHQKGMFGNALSARGARRPLQKARLTKRADFSLKIQGLRDEE